MNIEKASFDELIRALKKAQYELQIYWNNLSKKQRTNCKDSEFKETLDIINDVIKKNGKEVT
jgi:RNA polymerase-interacting CarD/CdnL/TRCF family regulator